MATYEIFEYSLFIMNYKEHEIKKTDHGYFLTIINDELHCSVSLSAAKWLISHAISNNGAVLYQSGRVVA